MQEANTRSAGWSLQHPATIDQARTQMLFDPQTSGGLLIAIAAERAAALCQELQQRGYAQARVIGEVTALGPGSAASVRLR